ncbi:hypothetical protein [Streptomyces asiaticus]|uniref:hypothetical protein n=1 Tax=Streptomyces asiaticus TaxID=114695 RepID=UPI001BA90948|nr:hypothetical protein [Streptomyces asiaticus]
MSTGLEPFRAGRSGSVSGPSAYDPLREQAAGHADRPAEDPKVAAQALLRVVDAAEPPARIIFGTGGVEFISGVYERRLSDWRAAAPLFADQ